MHHAGVVNSIRPDIVICSKVSIPAAGSAMGTKSSDISSIAEVMFVFAGYRPRTLINVENIPAS